ncbi:MAG: hypothetical protein WAK26_19355, partial [Terracidiphilus sp.]
GTSSVAGSINLASSSTPEIGAFSAGVVLAGIPLVGGLAGAASTTTNTVEDKIGATSTNSTVSATGSISLEASDTPPASAVFPTNSIITQVLNEIGSNHVSKSANIVAFSGDIAASTGIAAGAAVVTNTVENRVKAEIANSKVTAGSDIDVIATSGAEAVGVAAGFSAAGFAAGNASVVTDIMQSTTTADISGASTISTGGNLDVKASDTVTVDALTFSLAASLGVGLGGSVVTNIYGDTTSAYVNGTDSSHLANIENAGQATIEAHDTVTMDGTAMGVSAGAVAAGASVTTSSIDGSLSAYVGDYAEIGQTAGMTVDALTVEADFIGSGTSTVYGLAGGIGAVSANVATSTIDTDVQAYIGNSDVTVTGAVNVLAMATPDAEADAYGVAVGGLAVGASTATATASPEISAYAGGNSSTIVAGSLTISAERITPAGGYSANANASGSVGALVAVNATVSTATSGGTVQSYVAPDATLSVVTTIDVDATGGGSQNSLANSDNVGLIAAGGNVSTVNNNVTTLSYIGTGTDVTAGTVIGGLAAGTIYYVVLDDVATFDTTDVSNDEVTLDGNHGLQNGDLVTYIQGSGPSIGLADSTIYMVKLDPSNSSKISLYAWNSTDNAYDTEVTLTPSTASGTSTFEINAPRQVYLATSYENATAATPITLTLSQPTIAGGDNSLTPFEVSGGTTSTFSPATALNG